MYFVKSFVVLAVAAALASAMPGVDRRIEGGILRHRSNCGPKNGDCFQNGCEAVFTYPHDTVGVCSAGTYKGCDCDKCGGGVGYIGWCEKNGCDAVLGFCTAGQFQGCRCKKI